MSSGAGGFMAGLLLGAAAGVAVGLLLSPGTGEQNRAKVAEVVPELSERAPSLFNRIKADIRTRLAGGKTAYREAAAETRQRLVAELEATHHHIM